MTGPMVQKTTLPIEQNSTEISDSRKSSGETMTRSSSEMDWLKAMVSLYSLATEMILSTLEAIGTKLSLMVVVAMTPSTYQSKEVPWLFTAAMAMMSLTLTGNKTCRRVNSLQLNCTETQAMTK